MEQVVYALDSPPQLEREELRRLFGGKALGLMDMMRLGMNVPASFIIVSSVCNFVNNHEWPDEVEQQSSQNLAALEQKTGKGLGDPSRPLLVSVRSGAAVSMPGMMNTILNVGLNDETVRGYGAHVAQLLAVAEESPEKRADAQRTGYQSAYHSYRRLISMFADSVFGVDPKEFASIIKRHMEASGVSEEKDLSVPVLQNVVEDFKRHFQARTFQEFPQDARTQLRMASKAVFGSWNGEFAVEHRKRHGIDSSMGTAVTVVEMRDGGRGEFSGTGVAFSRNKDTGEIGINGNFLRTAQGEDIVSGSHTPMSLDDMNGPFAAIRQQLTEYVKQLEHLDDDMVDVEFTVEDDGTGPVLWMLQTRSGKRSGQAAFKIAHDLAADPEFPNFTADKAILRLTADDAARVLYKQLENAEDPIGKGAPASPGAAHGVAVFSWEKAIELTSAGTESNRTPVILMRPETTNNDLRGMHVSAGIVTSHGGALSHAAVIATMDGIPAVVGLGDMTFKDSHVEINGVVINEGDWVTMDGSSGLVFNRKINLIDAKLTDEFFEVLNWSDDRSRLVVGANFDTASQAQRAIMLGALFGGLVRTEHMFKEEGRFPVIRQMVLATSEQERQEAFDAILPMQQSDFEKIFLVTAAAGKESGRPFPVTVRLFDMPLHELLPPKSEYEYTLAREGHTPDDTGLSPDARAEYEQVLKWEEHNPMMGKRAIRLAMLLPGLYEMQVRAIMNGAAAAQAQGLTPDVEIMVPLVINEAEMKWARELIDRVAGEVNATLDRPLSYKVGTMIETPAAALNAEGIAKWCDFFSFGTNDLTATTLALSRDDASAIIAEYIERGIFDQSPFKTLDPAVAKMVEIAVINGLNGNPNLIFGVCGSHAGDARSAAVFHEAGVNKVSPAPNGVPAARLAAAQAALREMIREQMQEVVRRAEQTLSNTTLVAPEGIASGSGGGLPTATLGGLTLGPI